MSRVEMATQGWGWVADGKGNALAGQAVGLTAIDGSPALHWDAVTGGTSSTVALVTNTDGTLPRFIEEGSYLLSVQGAAVRRVEAVSGSSSILTQAATIEELASAVLSSTIINVATTLPIWTAPFACEIVGARVAVWGTGGVSGISSETDYWTVDLRRYRGGTFASIATKTTKLTGGEAMVSRVDWNFDAIAFDVTNKVFQTGDISAMAFTPSGTVNALNLPVMAQIRYRPL